MSAGLYNMTVEQGATFSRVITYRDGAGVLISLVGYTARLTARTKFSASVIFSLTTENGGIVLGGALGTITLTITAAATAALAGGTSGVYDLELVDGSGVVTRVMRGAVIISRESTT